MQHPTVFPWRTYDDAEGAIAFLESSMQSSGSATGS